MSTRLLLDEHYAEEIAAALRERGHDVVAVVSDPDLRGASDPTVFRLAAQAGRRIVTENIKDLRPLLLHAATTDAPAATLLLVAPRRFPRGRGDRADAIVEALDGWLTRRDSGERPAEDWLSENSDQSNTPARRTVGGRTRSIPMEQTCWVG